MPKFRSVSHFLSLFSIAGAVLAGPPPLDCAKKSLAEAVAKAGESETIAFTGVCAGPVVVVQDNLTLQGTGNAVIDGHGQDAITIIGATGVKLAQLEVRNGRNGIVGQNGAHLELAGVVVHDNAVFGVSLQTGSGAILSDVSISRSGVHGLDLETGSAATVTGTFTTSNNRVFGINVNGSSITFSRANVTASGNALGIQIATGANAFINDPSTILTVKDNIATGLTVVSGAQMVSFGGTITASGNGVNGVSINSKPGAEIRML